jgi:hypothetical protein
VSRDTFAEEIVDPLATRVFARSAFEYGHDPEAPPVEAVVLVVTVVQPDVAAAVPVPPQAATSNPAATSRAAMSVMRHWKLIAE